MFEPVAGARNVGRFPLSSGPARSPADRLITNLANPDVDRRLFVGVDAVSTDLRSPLRSGRRPRALDCDLAVVPGRRPYGHERLRDDHLGRTQQLGAKVVKEAQQLAGSRSTRTRRT